MRTLRSVIRKFILPVACFACAAWIAGFVISFTALNHRNVGTLVLYAFAGMVLLLPWFVIAVAILDRMRAKTTSDSPPQREEDLDPDERTGTGASVR